METLVQHLPLVLHVGADGLEGQAEVEAAVLDVAADSVQLWVGQVVRGGLLAAEGGATKSHSWLFGQFVVVCVIFN